MGAVAVGGVDAALIRLAMPVTTTSRLQGGGLHSPDDRPVHAGGGLVGEHHLRVGEPGRGQTVQVLRPGQGTGDAPDVGAAFGPLRRRQMVLGDDIGDPQPPARGQHPEHLADHRRLVGGQVDHAVGDHHVDRAVRQRDVLDLALHELHVVGAGLDRVRPGQGEHLVGHVQAVGEPGRADPAGRQQHVDAAAGAQVQHPFPVPEFGHRQRVPAAQRGQHRLLGQPVGLPRGVAGRHRRCRPRRCR